ncbi:MAG: flagellar hook-length control protein FliK [SAR324 cluster bacterium]|nr:flagellar hook-length control protein FliK [SAR324 cluster bacterium]
MIDALQLAPTSSKSPLAKKPEPYSSSFKETLRQADGSDKEYLETSSNVRDSEETRPDSREKIRRKVAEGKESKGDHRIKIVDSDEEMPRGPEEIAVLERALRALDEKAKELEFNDSELVGGLTEEQATELARLRAMIEGVLNGEEPSQELIAEDQEAFTALLATLNLKEGDAARLERDLGFTGFGEPTGEEVRNDGSIAVNGFGSGSRSLADDPNLGRLQAKVGDNPESGNPDLELVALKERKNLMNLTEAQKAEDLDPNDPRFNSGTIDPERAEMSIEEQIQMAKANRLVNQELEAATKSAFSKQEILKNSSELAIQKDLTQQQKLEEILMHQHVEGKNLEAEQTLESLKAQQMILGGNVSNSANSIDHARLATSMSGVNAIALEMQQQRENASARDFLNNGEQESNSSGNLPQSQLSKIASATDAKSASGMTFAQVQDVLAESPFDMSQLTRNLRKGREGESQEVTLRLRPDELGTLTMKVRQLGDRLQVEMQVENPHVKQLVESDLEQLRNRFLDKEFNFSEMELTVNIDARSDADSQAFENQGRYQDDTAAASQKQRLNAAQESASVVRPQTRSDGSLNLYA